MEDIRIKASPQTLQAASGDVESTVESIRSHFSAIETAVNRSAGYWQGDAANAHRAAYQEMKGTTDEILMRLKEHATDLRSMAEMYLGAEQQAAETSKNLPADVII